MPLVKGKAKISNPSAEAGVSNPLPPPAGVSVPPSETNGKTKSVSDKEAQIARLTMSDVLHSPAFAGFNTREDEIVPKAFTRVEEIIKGYRQRGWLK